MDIRHTGIGGTLRCAVMAALIAVPATLASTPEAASVSYHILRVQLRTTATGARYRFTNATRLLSARQLGGEGNALKRGVTQEAIWVRPSVGGQTASVIADYAVMPEAAGEGIVCSFAQWGDGVSVLEASRITPAGVIVRIDKHRRTSPGSGDITLNLSALAAAPPRARTVPKTTAPKMIWAFHYPWYHRPWDTSILLDRPLGGYYDSDSEALIRRQVQQARSAGIDGFISSWWGPDDYTDHNLATLLDTAQQEQFRVMINFETLIGLTPAGEPLVRSPAEIVCWLRYALARYGPHPAYMKVDGKPAVVVWVSDLVPAEKWSAILDQIHRSDLDVALIGMISGEWPRLDALEMFAGWHTYNILAFIQGNAQVPAVLAPGYARVARTLHNYALLEPAPRARIWAATIQPGYDDHLIPGRTSPVLPRAGGMLYLDTFDAAQRSDPDWIFVTSWNEWWEHTYVEPSVAYGAHYLALTRSLADEWKSVGRVRRDE